MKIIYGNSLQKSIDSSQRITRHEKRKKHEKNRSSAVRSRHSASLKRTLNTDETMDESLEWMAGIEETQGIPHEISLIKPDEENQETSLHCELNNSETAALSLSDSDFKKENLLCSVNSLEDGEEAEELVDKTNILSENSKNFQEDSKRLEPERTSEIYAAKNPPAMECVEKCETSSLLEVVSENTNKSLEVPKQEYKISSLTSIVSQSTGEPVPSCLSISPEGQTTLQHLNQLLDKTVQLHEILLPENKENQIPVIIFLHGETKGETELESQNK